jgi:hypothetical protein
MPREHLLELLTIPVLAGSLVHVLVNQRPALSRREGPELAQLVFSILFADPFEDTLAYVAIRIIAILVPKTNVIYVDRKLARNPTPNGSAGSPLFGTAT